MTTAKTEPESEVPGGLAQATTTEPNSVPPESVGAFFDVDETLVRGATAFWAAREMFVRQVFGIRDLIYAARQSLRFVLFGENRDLDKLVDRATRIVEGESVQDMLDISEHIFEHYFLPRVYQGTYERLKSHTEAGHQVWLISATPWIIAEVFARHLGLAGGIGTKVKIAEGRFLGGLDGSLIHGPAKVQVVRNIAEQSGLLLEESWAYSDSANDIPMLSTVGHPVAVNPDRELEHYARSVGWEVLVARKRIDVVRRNAIKGGIGVGLAGAAALIGRKIWSVWPRNP